MSRGVGMKTMLMIKIQANPEEIAEILINNEKEIEDLKKERDLLSTHAAKWKAFINCKRIKILGSGGLGGENQHLGFEIWDNYMATMDNTEAISNINTFVETILAREIDMNDKSLAGPCCPDKLEEINQLNRERACVDYIKEMAIASGNPAFSLIMDKINETIKLRTN